MYANQRVEREKFGYTAIDKHIRKLYNLIKDCG